MIERQNLKYIGKEGGNKTVTELGMQSYIKAVANDLEKKLRLPQQDAEPDRRRKALASRWQEAYENIH